MIRPCKKVGRYRRERRSKKYNGPLGDRSLPNSEISCVEDGCE